MLVLKINLFEIERGHTPNNKKKNRHAHTHTHTSWGPKGSLPGGPRRVWLGTPAGGPRTPRGRPEDSQYGNPGFAPQDAPGLPGRTPRGPRGLTRQNEKFRPCLKKHF